ncbi:MULTISPECIES: P-loop NTPase fold protein [Moraxella]|uniref:KAP NTPase domain-containing protein n=1 Tax=Moraxella lacunata TaxID=477 RepID=A0A1B8PZ00_MORLA|nr:MULTISPECIES: P-loop NTPase fold protein [Moraxella]MBE9588182.1 hypothetical protein [Moraxella sp. K1630]MBE9596269.1 hypothetical protein [Moraxella sp. K2450]MDH9219927.1 hypothetical protein [Moraxella lacunata]MDI4482396.1 hypothetical protein [Moraxella lacunata]MDI4507220.1 hypothetical protein [Moraxella lacunata]
MTNATSITIDLTQTSSVPLVDRDAIVHQQAFERLDALLKNILERSNTQRDQAAISHLEKQLSKQMVNNTIFIHGKRGAGKTTFLKSVLNHYLEPQNQQSNQSRILPIAFIDPTITHTHQHILIDIIVKINMATEEKFKYCSDDKKRQEYRESLQAMSEGLKLLTNHQPNPAHDAQWFLHQALKESKHGQVLEERFYDYINKVIDILGAELLIIAIDDVDTETKEAYEVLENIRSIITHPRVCVLLTGDENLYNTIVHQKKLESLGKADEKQMLHLESKSDMAIHLTQQYLLKVLPAQQRLKLKDLYSLLNDKEAIDIKLKHPNLPNNNTEKSLRDFWVNIFQQGLFLIKKEADKCVDFVLQQPIRSVIQLSKILADAQDPKNHVSPTALLEAFANVFYNELFTEKFDMDLLYKPNPAINGIGKTMVELYAKYGELETGFYARPDTNHDMFNACQLILSTLLANYNSTNKNSSKLGGMLAMMLATSAPCNILVNYVPDHDKSENIKDYINYIGLSNKDDIYSVAAHYSPIILNDITSGLAVKSGVIRIRRKSKTELKEYLKGMKSNPPINGVEYIDNSGTLSRLSQTAENLLVVKDDVDKNNNILATALSIITCRVSGHAIMTSRGVHDHISCYTLLAFIAELLNAKDESSFEKTFYQRLEIPTYSSPTFMGKADGMEDIDTDEENNNLNLNTSNKDLYKEIIDMLWNWKGEMDKLNIQGISSVLQGKVWTRVFYSLSRVSEDLRKKGFFDPKENQRKNINGGFGILLHELMTIHIVAIINAVMIEESRFLTSRKADEGIHKVLLTAQNVSTTLDKFEESLKRIGSVLKDTSISSKMHAKLGLPIEEFEWMKGLKEKLPLTYGLMTCPLLIPFLIHPLHSFDETAESKWRESTAIKETVKALLADKGWKECFISDNDSLQIIDMHYISALPILQA